MNLLTGIYFHSLLPDKIVTPLGLPVFTHWALRRKGATGNEQNLTRATVTWHIFYRRCIVKYSRMEWNFLSGVGAVFLGYYSLNFVLQVLHGIRAFALPAIGIKKNLKKLGQWAGEY